MNINWKVTKGESDLISRIAARAVNAGILSEPKRRVKQSHNSVTLMMDLTATHANGCPIDLEGLAVADDINFSHDVCGIMRYIDRNTGKLTDFFTPRYAMSDLTTEMARVAECHRGSGAHV